MSTTTAPAPSAAPAASSAPAAPAASSAPASTGGAEGSSAATGSTEGHGTESTGSQASSGLLKVNYNDENFYENLTDEQREQFDAGNFEIEDPNASAEVKKEGEDALEYDDNGDVVTKDQPEPKEEVQAQEGDSVLSAEEFAKLPPKVQEVLKQAQEVIQDEDFKVFKESREALDELLSDPRVLQIIDQRRRGNELQFDPNRVFDAQTIETLAKNAGVDLKKIDFVVDPEHAVEQFAKILGHAHQMGIDNGKVAANMDLAAQAKKQQIEKFYEDGFSEIMNEVPGAKGIRADDPKSPLKPFHDFLASNLSKGTMTHDSVAAIGIKPLYMAFLAKEGKLTELLHKPVANARQKFFEDAQKAGTQAIVASSARLGGKPQEQSKHGIDGQKYLTDASYKNQVLDKFSENEAVLSDLGTLELTGKW